MGLAAVYTVCYFAHARPIMLSIVLVILDKNGAGLYARTQVCRKAAGSPWRRLVCYVASQICLRLQILPISLAQNLSSKGFVRFMYNNSDIYIVVFFKNDIVPEILSEAHFGGGRFHNFLAEHAPRPPYRWCVCFAQ